MTNKAYNNEILSLDNWNYELSEGKLRLFFHQGNGPPIFTRNDLTLVFDPPKPTTITTEEATDIWLASTLPHAANKFTAVQIVGPVNDRQQHFWCDYLYRLTGLSNISFLPVLETEPKIRSITHGERLGLLFGCGVESLTTLSLILHLNPVLFSLHGPMWMNNDYSIYPLKKELENQLAESYSLQIIRVWHNLRPLFNETDEYVNQYITGGFMYYSLVPQMRELNIQMLLQTMELEYSLVSELYDRSIHPRFIHNIARKPLPPVLSVLNAIPKVELLQLLYSSNAELCRYMYSCFKNSEKRWCGECGKCRRISSFCKAVGIPLSLIGMQENIPDIRETGELTQLYWRSLDNYLTKNKMNRMFNSAKSGG